MGEAADALRLFVACELPDDVRRGLGSVQEELRRLGAGRLRWARPEGIHVTLKFLGAVEPARVAAIESALAAAVEPFEVRLRPAALGGFGGRRLRVLWMALEGDVEALAGLARRVDLALRPLRFPKERRPFAPHLTLARVPDQASSAERERLAGLIERFGRPDLPPMMLREVSLMRSILGPGGSAYERLAAFPGRTGGVAS